MNIFHSLILKLKPILNLSPKRSFIFLIGLITLSALLELTSIVSIIPFMSLLLNPDLIYSNKYFYYIFNFFNINNTNQFILLSGIFTFIFFITSTFFILFTRYSVIKFNQKLSIKLNNFLFKNYLHNEYDFFISNSPSVIIRSLNDDIFRIINGIIQPLLFIIARLILIFFISISLLIINLEITVFLFSILFLFYFILFSKFKVKVNNIGLNIGFYTSKKIKILNESFNSIKDIIVGDKFNFFHNYFDNIVKNLAQYQLSVSIISIIPRYVIDAIGFGLIILVILFMKLYFQSSLNQILTSVAFLVFSAYKIIPAFQEVYSSLIQIKNHTPALDNITSMYLDNNKNSNRLIKKIKLPKNSIEVDNIFFKYRNRPKNIIFNNANIRIHFNKSHVVIGKNGSGKSTLFEIILGLHKTDEIKVIFDDMVQDANYLVYLRPFISYVSQGSFLLDETILSNICFGQSTKNINKKLLRQAINIAELEYFINTLPEGLNTLIGDNGIAVSGGQKQRIIIARSIYQNKPVIVYDEAMSALDEISENKILKSILNLKGKTIVLITHKISLIQKFDYVYKINNKKITKVVNLK